jgi:outer membrane protein TolC
MKTRIALILFLAIMNFRAALPQKAVTLGECYNQALKKSALAGEKDTYNEIWQLADRNLSRNWLPSLDANASFLYNSEVVDLSGVFAAAPIPGLAAAIRPLPHEQYKVTLDINQMIYDGGAVKNARAAEEAAMKVNQQQTETDLYRLRSQINSCFFSIMLIDRQKELLESYLALIDKRIKSMQSALDNGVIMKSDLDVMSAEKIKLEQQLSENAFKRRSLVKVLSELTGGEFEAGSQFVSPEVPGKNKYEILRPELKVFDLRKEQLDAGIGVLQSKRMPKAFAFATLGYGNPPGSNFFRDEFAPYYIIGAGFKWNIYDWSRVKNEKQQIRLQQEIIDGRKNDLDDSFRRAMELKNSEIESLQEALSRDAEIIALRKKISVSAESQYENGTITATDLLNEMNSLKQAEINLEIHRINLEMARVEYLNIMGQDIE